MAYETVRDVSGETIFTPENVGGEVRVTYTVHFVRVPKAEGSRVLIDGLDFKIFSPPGSSEPIENDSLDDLVAVADKDDDDESLMSNLQGLHRFAQNIVDGYLHSAQIGQSNE